MKYKYRFNTLLTALNYFYSKSLSGLAGIESAEHLARNYMNQPDLSKSIDQLIRRQTLQTGSVGFITGLGGLFTLPVSLPANLSAVLFLQIRMIAAIAYMCGYDLKDDKVQTLVYATLCGTAVTDILKKTGINTASRLGQQLGQTYLNTEVMKKIHHIVGQRLLNQTSKAGMTKATTLIPLIGGLVSGTIEATATSIIGHTAKKIFYSPETNQRHTDKHIQS
ncbi:EcsC family protein [Neisseriaceae bacterium ESL0693]|nr:EcsC family protein [Neisseriaceae bacterium ESL0693]